MKWERVKLIATTILAIWGLLAIMSGVWEKLNQSAQAAQREEINQLRETDKFIIGREDAIDRRVDKLVNIMEINSTLQIEPKGSPEYANAVARLRAMRRIVN